MEVEIVSAQIGNRWVAFKKGADLSEFDETKLQTWVFEHKPCTTGTLIQAGSKIEVATTSPAFNLSYNLAFAEVHVLKVHGVLISEKPDRTFLESIPTAILTAFVIRADTSRTVTSEEFEELKKPKPSEE